MKALKQLVESFEDGLPESVYNATVDLITETLGQKSAERFCACISATEGSFYIREGYLEFLWNEMLEVKQDDRNHEES